MKRHFILSIMILMCALSISAQPYCQINTYTTRDGIPSNSIAGMGRASNGLMWFATLNGLCCYDGHRFMNFRNTPDRHDEKAVNRQIIIKLDERDNVWSITYERSVYMFDTHTCQFVDVNGIIKEKFGKNLRTRAFYGGSNGAIWLVNNEDGQSFKVDIHKMKDGEGIEMVDLATDYLLGNAIKKIECDSKGDEWIFTEKGIIRYRDKYLIEQPLEYMTEAAGKFVYATVDGRMFTYADNSQLQVVNLPETVNKIYTLKSLDASKVILSSNIGIIAYDVKANKASKMPFGLKGNATDIYKDSKGRFWFFTDAGQMAVYDVKKSHFSAVDVEKQPGVQYTVTEQTIFHEDANGTIWLSPNGGYFGYYDEETRKHCPQQLRSDRDSYGNLATLNKFETDKEKNIWFTSTRDIHHLQFKYDQFKFTDVYSNTEVRSLLCDNKGRIWAGTYNGILAVYDSNGKLLGYLDRNGKIQKESTVFAQRIYSLKQDRKGRIWIGTKGSGLFIYDGEGSLRNYRHDPADKYSLSYDEVYDMDIDERGNIWLATFVGGLNLVRDTAAGMRFYNYRNEMPQYLISKYGKIRRITHDGKGTVILSTNNGLLTFSNCFKSPEEIKFFENRMNGQSKASLLTNDVMQTQVMKNGDIYVLTLGGGVQLVKSDNLLQNNIQFQAIEKMSSSESIIQSVLEDADGCLWLIKESTADRYNPKDSTLVQYSSSTIGDKIEFSEALPAYCAQTNMVIAAARGGFARFGKETLAKSDYCPNIVFMSVQYQGEHKRLPILNSGKLIVPAEKRNLTVYFSALEYKDNDLVEYAYRLEGLDDDWNYVGAVNNASLSHLSAGKYRLLVKSTNSDGVEVDNIAELEIEVEPTFWETGWAKLIYILLLCMAVYLVFYVYNLNNRSRMERKLNDMKTRFFTDISHKLRTPLTLIGGPVVEVLNSKGLPEGVRGHLEMVQRNASQMLELVNQMLKYSMERGVYISDEEVPQASAVDDTVDEDMKADDEPVAGENTDGSSSRSTLLVVEDNADLRTFLVGILSNEYNVLQAENGKIGLDIAQKEMPDFIITDVMMPVMDGLTMVKKIKKDNNICHIPIIVLSAKASMEDRIEGLKSGIDDYITKPFSATYLKLRVSNIISHRRMMQQTYVEQLKPEDHKTYKLDAPEIVNADNEMMKTLMDFLEKRIDEPGLKIEELADAVHLGRSVFYGKIKSIVGMTPVDFVRHIRLQRAEELISKSDYSFSQIAYMVGFSDPKYFSKCFKKQTGMTPSEYRGANLGGSNEE